MLHPTDDRPGLAPKTVYEVHVIIRGALDTAVRRGMISRSVALIAAAPRMRSIPKTEPQAWTADQLQRFLGAAAGHRLFPALWLAAATGMRRNELLGLRWSDLDIEHQRLSINRGLVAIGYELHETRGKTPTSRRCIDLDTSTITILEGWRSMQAAEHLAALANNPEQWLFTTATGERVHPHAVSQAFEPSSFTPQALSPGAPVRADPRPRTPRRVRGARRALRGSPATSTPGRPRRVRAWTLRSG